MATKPFPSLNIFIILVLEKHTYGIYIQPYDLFPLQAIHCLCRELDDIHLHLSG
jgi:hypothetical protein